MTIDDPFQLREVMGADFTFSDQQFAAITAPLAPAVVIAGAGSGKTTVMAARVVWLVATGQVAPAEILGLTFTTKATAELGARIRAALDDAGLLPSRTEEDEVEEPTVSTYHSYAAALLTEHGLRIGHEPDTRLIADASRYQLASRAIQRYRQPVPCLTESPDHAVRYLLALDAEMSEHLVQPDQVRAYDARQRELFVAGMEGETRVTYREHNEKAIRAIDGRADLLGLVEAYRRLKTDLGLMDFSDQISLAATLAAKRPEVGEIERAKFKVVLLDEYQDTSVAQALMLSRLFSGPDPTSGLGHPVTAVGDPNQAIYGWRGASVSNILEFGRAFPPRSGGTMTYPLTVNRRSDQRILATANHLAAELYAERPELQPLQAAEGALPGEVRAAVHETWDEELGCLADAVARCHETGTSWREIGVLTRDNTHAAAAFDALTRREIPVEIVGLKGLLRLPEVAEVVATLSLIQDVTDNASMLTLLNGPRWAVGPRDLALLGRRARVLAGGRGRGKAATDIHAELQSAVLGSDPAEVASLGDALDDPGDLDYSPEARDRFALLSAELRRLRAGIGEPILDLVRRIIDTTGIDIELASSVSPAAAARRDNLDLFVQAVAEFQAVDGAVTLTALMAWLDAEDEFGQGLDVATPSEADSVKLLTVHRAKGLEWDAVFLVGVTETKFPSSRGRSRWVTVASVMPAELRGDAADLPQLGGHRAEDIKAYGVAAKEHDQTEELRLGYVAWTRARHLLAVSCWTWKPKAKAGQGPSSYLRRTREAMTGWGATAEPWADKPEKGSANPYSATSDERSWPIPHHTAEVDRRLAAAALVDGVGQTDADDGIEDVLDLERVQAWDTAIEQLLAEARAETADVVHVPLPASLSATSVARLRGDPGEFARELARPMPRQPSPSARFGTRFHAWVESRFGQQQMIDPDELPGRGDVGIDDEDELKELIARFEEGPFGDRTPYAVEPPFALVLAGQVVRGRIDAVYEEPVDERPGYLLVDWKTNRRQDADPLQLAIYRVAWAELMGVDPAQVRVAFHYVRTGSTVAYDAAELPDRKALEDLFRT
jgi:DNA helicase-2/ATP-dependent DNA helicase PcrA